jgi:molecular chaperone GrpE
MSNSNTNQGDPRVAGEPGTSAPGADSPDGLLARLKAAEEARDQFRHLAQMARADFENYQKRAARDLEQERRFAVLPLARDLLRAIDNLERATAAAQKAGETGPLVQGVAMVHSQLLDVLRRHGITPIEAKGQPFDTRFHEAVVEVPTANAPPHTVVDVLEPGYLMHDRVLRAAKVAVSVPPRGEQAAFEPK